MHASHPLGTEGRLNALSAELKRTPFPSRVGIWNMIAVVLFFTSFLPTVPRMAA